MSAPPKHTEPPDDERVAALQDGEVHGAERDALLSHLADDQVGDYQVFADTAEVLRALEPPPLRRLTCPSCRALGSESKGKWERSEATAAGRLEWYMGAKHMHHSRCQVFWNSEARTHRQRVHSPAVAASRSTLCCEALINS